MISAIRHAFRQLVKSPGFTLISLATLALGIGINTSAFTILNRFLFVSLPFRDAHRLVQVFQTSPQQNANNQAPGDFFDERDQSTVMEGMATYYVDGSASLALPGQPAQLAQIMPVNADYFKVMGITPALGRAFTQQEESQDAPLVILSNAFWLKNYGGDPKVLGHTLRVNGIVVTIIGVMSPLLDDPMLFGSKLDLWRLDNPEVNRNMRDHAWYNVAGRLKPGATVAQAQAEMTAIAGRLAHDYPKTNFQRGFRVIAYPSNSIGDMGYSIVWMIMDLALVVLLIACANLANLQLVRTTGRSRELAIRLALGSSRSRLTGMLLLESLILSLVGGALGLLVAVWSNAFLGAALDIDTTLNVRILVFAFVASALTGAVFGTLPAWLASKSDLNSVLKQGGRGSTVDSSRHRLRNSLIVAQLAMALTLLTGAGYYVRGFEKIMRNDRGWRTDNVLMGFFSLSHAGYGEERDERARVFGDRFRAALQALPGVDHAALSQGVVLFGGGSSGFLIEGRPVPPKGKEPVADSEVVSTDFFATTGIQLEQGREFTDADRPNSKHVVIISSSMARKYWPGESAIGKRIGDPNEDKTDWLEIVGIVGDINGMMDVTPRESHYETYRAWDQNALRQVGFWLHSPHDPRVLEDGVRKALAKIEPDGAINFMQTADEFMASNLIGFAVVRRMLLEIAGLGLLLSAVGIYGVIANLASERTQEVGIRMALGAQPNDVLWLFLRNGIRLSVIGTVIGLAASFGLMSVLNRTMSVVPGNDPWVVVLVAILLAAVALLACWLPARRATSVNPIEALRSD